MRAILQTIDSVGPKERAAMRSRLAKLQLILDRAQSVSSTQGSVNREALREMVMRQPADTALLYFFAGVENTYAWLAIASLTSGSLD
jgi:hypothetical protein